MHFSKTSYDHNSSFMPLTLDIKKHVAMVLICISLIIHKIEHPLYVYVPLC